MSLTKEDLLSVKKNIEQYMENSGKTGDSLFIGNDGVPYFVSPKEFVDKTNGKDVYADVLNKLKELDEA